MGHVLSKTGIAKILPLTGAGQLYKKVAVDPVKAQNNVQDVVETQTAALQKTQSDQLEQQTNAVNAKAPASILNGIQAAAKGGIAGTMLTGAGGVDPSTLVLGKNTLLGS
jgi:hypothetical protein